MSVNLEVKGSLAKCLATENLIIEHKKVPTACFDVDLRVLTLPMWDKASATSSSFYGYFGGGSVPGIPSSINTISRLDFSNETVSDPGKNLPTVRYMLSATSNSN